MKATAFTTADLTALPALQPDGWGDITPNFEYYTRSSFCFPIKITSGDRIVGIGSTILHNDVAWLAHIIVHKEHRKQGIGKLVTETLVESLQSTKCSTIYLLATDLGAPVYEKAGFETETEYLFFKDVKLNNQPPVQEAIQPYHEKYKAQMAALDQATSGEDRLFHLEEHLQQGFVYGDNGTVNGYYLPTFGDGLIIAADPKAGLALLGFHCTLRDKAVFPKDNLTATQFLYEHGNKEITTGKRMRLGEKRPLYLERIYNRIGGNLG